MKNWVYRRGNTVLLDFNPWVFITSSFIILLFVLASFLFVKELASTFNELQAWIANTTGWFFVLTTNLILAFMVYLAIGRFSGVRLGGPEARPDYSYAGWFAMLFSAGMGIGLLFYSIAEPMYHLFTPPHGAEPRTVAAAEDAMKTTFLHLSLIHI